MPPIKLSDFIAKLQALNTGADKYVVIRSDDGSLWDVGAENSRVDGRGSGPYAYNDDFPHALVLLPEQAD